jgi:hypothetical protein
MKPPVECGKMKRRLTTLWQKIVAGIAVAVAIAVPRLGHAAKTQPTPSFSERAAKVKKAIEQMAQSIKHSGPGSHLMQWYNWGNWNNWPNWGNWNNWRNWSNWLKY